MEYTTYNSKGIIIAAPLSNMPKIVRAVRETGTPFVRLSPGAGNGDELTVSTNDREFSAEMTRYLASLGHDRIAFIKGDPEHKAVGNRYDGYKDGLEQSGLEYRAELVAQGDNSLGSGESCAAELLQHLIEEDEPELPAGEEKGLILKKFMCDSCHAALEPKPDHKHTFSIEIELEEIDAFGVDLTMPVYKCSACGKEQLHSLREVRKLTPKAMAHAFQDANIPPPPGVL